MMRSKRRSRISSTGRPASGRGWISDRASAAPPSTSAAGCSGSDPTCATTRFAAASISCRRASPVNSRVRSSGATGALNHSLRKRKKPRKKRGGKGKRGASAVRLPSASLRVVLLAVDAARDPILSLLDAESLAAGQRAVASHPSDGMVEAGLAALETRGFARGQRAARDAARDPLLLAFLAVADAAGFGRRRERQREDRGGSDGEGETRFSLHGSCLRSFRRAPWLRVYSGSGRKAIAG